MKYSFQIVVQTPDGRMVDTTLIDPLTKKPIILEGELISLVLKQLVEPLSEFEKCLKFDLTIRGISSKVEL